MPAALHIEPQDRDAMHASGLADYDALTRPGVDLADGRGTHELTLRDGTRIYRKVVRHERLTSVLAPCVHGGRPHSAPVREAITLRMLRRAGFPAARPIAWGERCRFGVPREGVLVTECVAGESLETVLETADAYARRRWMRRVGELLGRLHGAGFFQVVRPKDLIIASADAPDGMWKAGEPVLIDREARRWRPSRFTWRQASTVLARTEHRLGRLGQPLSTRDGLALLHAYLRQIPPGDRIPLRTFAEAIAARTTRKRRRLGESQSERA